MEQLLKLHASPHLISGWIRNQQKLGSEPILQSSDIQKLALMRPPTLKERIEGYLLAVSRSLNALDERFAIHSPSLVAAAYCASSAELSTITSYLKTKRYLDYDGRLGAQLTVEGHAFCEELRLERSASSQGFIAMWFDPSMDEARVSGLERGIQLAGYDALRIDNKEHINDITDEIIAEIRASRFVVADLTGQRNGVYYEAGFAAGLNKPVFYTCRKAEIPKIHFDIRQISCIDWDEPSDLSERLSRRILALIGAGPRKI